MKYVFPKDFLWGASTSSHQIEGGLKNNWSEWEILTARERSENIPDWYEFPQNILEEAKDPTKRISGKGCDSYNRWREDIAALKELGLNSYRFSIEWSRIFPEKGLVSESGLEYYKELISELKKNDIEPVLTCWHWTLPLWLEEEGGLLSSNIDEYFREYFRVLAKNFAGDVKYWITLNEPDIVTSNSYLLGLWPPCKKNIFTFIYLFYVKMVKLHKIGYEEIKDVNNLALVGVAKNNAALEPYNKNWWNVLVCRLGHYFYNILYLKKIQKYLDFIGLNFYFLHKMGIMGQRNDNDKISDMGWWMKPSALYNALVDLKGFDLPVMVTENGVADSLDQYRGWWLDESFDAMEKALKSGVRLIGYMHWSLIDNFEWAEGFWPKFGLVDINRNVKESGYHYKELIAKRGNFVR